MREILRVLGECLAITAGVGAVVFVVLLTAVVAQHCMDSHKESAHDQTEWIGGDP